MRIAITLAALIAMSSTPSWGQEITLRLHQMLPAQAAMPSEAIVPWAERVEEDSDGRIQIELYHSMSLGGSPPQLYDQAVDGVADIIWTVIGYTPGRFPTAEAFELPFIMRDGEITSKAFHEYCELYCLEDFSDVKVLAFHTHGPGLIHSIGPVEGLDDMAGLKIRGGSRVVNQLLTELGAAPVGMPVPQVPEALSRGVIDATTLPWETTPALRISEIAKNHTAFPGDHGLFTQTFIFAMNRSSYDQMPEDLRAVIDTNSGIELAALMGRVTDEGDVIGYELAKELGNSIYTINEQEMPRWEEISERLIDRWIEEMNSNGLDGTHLVSEARRLVAEHSRD